MTGKWRPDQRELKIWRALPNIVLVLGNEKEQHGNIGKGRVEATLHSKGRDSGQEITSLVFLFLIFSGHGLIFTLFLNIYDHHFLNYVAGIISFLPLLYIWS